MTAIERLGLELESDGTEYALALRPLILAARTCEAKHDRAAEDPCLCPNCGADCQSAASPYCGDPCREEAAFVRQFRRALAEGAVFDPERRNMIAQAFWHALGGGYPARVALVPESARKQVLKRTGGLCEICGAPAVTFDHEGSG
jgi:hypothetical protein